MCSGYNPNLERVMGQAGRHDLLPRDPGSRPGFTGPSLSTAIFPSLNFCSICRLRGFYEETEKL